MIIQFLVSLAATLSFAVLFSAEKKQLFFCGLTGALGWIVYLICLQYHTDNAIANLIATFALTLVARILSAVRRTPVTVFLLTGIFPLVPGAGIYYTSYYFIMGDMSRFSQYGISTVKVAGSIVLGIIFGFALPQSLFNGLSKLVHNDERFVLFIAVRRSLPPDPPDIPSAPFSLRAVVLSVLFLL